MPISAGVADVGFQCHNRTYVRIGWEVKWRNLTSQARPFRLTPLSV